MTVRAGSLWYGQEIASNNPMFKNPAEMPSTMNPMARHQAGVGGDTAARYTSAAAARTQAETKVNETPRRGMIRRPTAADPTSPAARDRK